MSAVQRCRFALLEKAKGNECFKAGECGDALAFYSRSLALLGDSHPQSPVLGGAGRGGWGGGMEGGREGGWEGEREGGRERERGGGEAKPMAHPPTHPHPPHPQPTGWTGMPTRVVGTRK
jgi:hypothetical protein